MKSKIIGITVSTFAILMNISSAVYADTTPESIGHRGAMKYAPENTIASFDFAKRIGADVIETDIQLTKDNKLVIMHDKTLDRTTNGSGYIKYKNYREVHSYKSGEWFVDNNNNLTKQQKYSYNRQTVPSLDYMFYKYKDTMKYLVETEKTGTWTPGMEKVLVDVMRKNNMLSYANLKSERVVIQSYSVDSLKRVKNLDSRIPTRILYNANVFKNMTYYQIKSIKNYADSISVYYKDLTPNNMKTLKSLNIKVYPYTVNDTYSMKYLTDLGVNGIITNTPDVYEQLLSNY